MKHRDTKLVIELKAKGLSKLEIACQLWITKKTVQDILDNQEEIPICACCGDSEIGEVSSGDEGWTVCRACGTIEGGYEYITEAEAIERGLL